MMCCDRRKRVFNFENGTIVSASDYGSAIDKLFRVNEKRFSIEKMDEYKWVCKFSSDVRVEYESSSRSKAELHGPWYLHLDRRLIVSDDA